ncbi:hypothetical protein BDQ94DRAFT_162426 [Aspergillus welwitschiae]|uniref:Uncharacterized protein n=1 Tax=Aspergillus welwitschiae TaxID=1341132 RepID=A0A3F3PQA9_9EURO|nr:hypothetical protein BDQ94DRAFT_162426 [Aspergillus welwitschiae]RDH29023.1 hypothetical protein BDQ94DRAFT_162426 [Aspergillus welwitschiae]
MGIFEGTNISPAAKFTAPDRRSTQGSYTRSLIPCLILCYYIPGFWMLYKDSGVHSHLGWKFVLLSTLFRLSHVQIASLLRRTTVKELIKTPDADMPYMRISYYTCGLLSGAMSIIWRALASRSLCAGSLPISQVLYQATSSIHIDHHGMTGYVCGLTWLLFEYKDMKLAKVISLSWSCLILMGTLVTLVFGPAAALMLGWGLREEYLAKYAIQH